MKILDKEQHIMYKYCCSVNNPLLFVDMRMGKSIVAIRWVKTIVDKGLILITCPYSGLFGWVDELRGEGEENIILAIGGKDARLSIAHRLIKEPEDNICWVLTNPEFHRGCAEIIRKPYKVWIADEATYLQNYKSKISQFFFKQSGHIQNKAALTGTPATEGEHQFYMLCKTIESNSFPESNYYKFLNNNFGLLPDNRTYLTNAHGSKYITGRLAQFALFMNRQDLGLGGTITKVTRYSSLDDIRKVYKKAEKEFILEIKDKDIYEETIWATTKWLWLRRLCGGIVDGIVIDKTKLDDLKNLIISEFAGKQILIWAVYYDEIDFIYKWLLPHFKIATIDGRKKPLQREKHRKEFMSGEIEILICNPAAMRFGADCSAADVVIYYSLPVSGLTYAQSEARPINIRLNNNLLFVYMMREKSVEVDIYKSVIKKEGKRATIRNIVNGIQERMR